jgi:hypothetical protein
MPLLDFFGRGQAEKEFRVEVEAIKQVRDKNLVHLLGYYAKGAGRYCHIHGIDYVFVQGEIIPPHI